MANSNTAASKRGRNFANMYNSLIEKDSALEAITGATADKFLDNLGQAKRAGGVVDLADPTLQSVAARYAMSATFAAKALTVLSSTLGLGRLS